VVSKCRIGAVVVHMGLNSGNTKAELRNAAADAVEGHTKVQVIQDFLSLFLFCFPSRGSIVIDSLRKKHRCKKELRDGS
jgi:hypothetical protein